MFNVLIKLQVHGCFASGSSMDVWLERRLTLPFPPFNGLRIMFGPEVETVLIGRERTGNDPEPVEMYWDVYANQFVVYLSDQTIYWAQLRRQEHPPIDEIVARYLVEGWQRKTRVKMEDTKATQGDQIK